MAIALNPILSGFYPDPSICSADNKFYLVNSTFAYFPGVPIFESNDLANWKQIGNILTRNTQLPLEGAKQSEGIYAPTIRYHEGIWYMITTNVSGSGNFIVTAEKPAGPWSEPYFLGDQAIGFDPSLFFDTNGNAYYVGTRPNPKGVRYNGDYEIWVQRIDLVKMELLDESYTIWKGAMKGAIWPEGPHLYKRGEWYYLVCAEGGTADDHCVVVARSKNLFGPYENNPKNPILTHRHMGKDYPVQFVGHADLVETPQNQWYMVMLGSRPEKGYTLLGRETFLAEVKWEEDWPVVNPGWGRLTSQLETGILSDEKEQLPKIYRFFDEQLPFEMMMLRNPKGDESILDSKRGILRLVMKKWTLADKETPAYVGIRQKSHEYIAETSFVLRNRQKDDCAGLAIVQSEDYHVRFEVYYAKEKRVRVIRVKAGKKEILIDTLMPTEENILRIVCKQQKLIFGYADLDGKSCMVLGDLDASFLSTEVAGGFVGCTVGMYASGNGKDSDGYADFERFGYQ